MANLIWTDANLNRKAVLPMEIIRPHKFGAVSLPDRESRMICRSVLLDIIGEAKIAVEDGNLSGVTGLFWRYVSLSLATLYLPKAPLTLSAAGASDPGIVILRAMDGSLAVEQGRRRAELKKGDVIFLASGAPSAIVLKQGGRLDCAHISGHAFTSAIDLLQPIIMRPLEADCLPLQLLTNYAGYLLRQEYHSQQDAGMMVAHFYGLLPVLVQHLGNAEPSDNSLNRLGLIKALIEENLSDGTFSIAHVAEAQGITPRAIQKLFSREGTTYSSYVLGRRLALAQGMILSEAATVPISQIAYNVGFNDLSYFNRTFRTRYGTRPSDLRRAANGGA
jgi:AraC-like DNA-binding protein